METISPILWVHEFATGIDTIDEQHQKLFCIYNTLVNEISESRYDQIKQTIDELLKYSETHFTYEEQLMEKCKFEERAQHAREHRGFIHQIMDLMIGNSEGICAETIETFARFLQIWLINHITDTDRKYVDLIKSPL